MIYRNMTYRQKDRYDFKHLIISSKFLLLKRNLFSSISQLSIFATEHKANCKQQQQQQQQQLFKLFLLARQRAPPHRQ